jgi:hypothetical protein
MPKARTTLRETAAQFLRMHQTPDAAASPFADLIATDEGLRRALALNYLQSIAPKEPASRRRPGPHRRPGGMPTERQKLAAITAERVYTDQIFARKLRGGKTLGEIHVHELRALAKSAAEMTTRFVLRGHEDAVDLFACTALANYCVAADPFALVKDTIKSSVVVSIYEQAKKVAAEKLPLMSEQMTDELINAANDLEPPPMATQPPPRPRQPRGGAGARPAV